MFHDRIGRGTLGSALAILLLASVVLPAGATSEDPVRVSGSERYALKLLNCTRTGGWVTTTGKCKARGSGRYSPKLMPLKRSQGISNKVAWPWARTLTDAQACDHVLPGEPAPAQRMSTKGYGLAAFGENVGCGWGGASPRQVVLGTHLAMQAEKSDGGGHWLNMKYAGFKSVGIGVATRDGRTSVVYDFYGKRAY
jgi:hypothetical protein